MVDSHFDYLKIVFLISQGRNENVKFLFIEFASARDQVRAQNLSQNSTVMRLFPIISIAMRVAVMAKPTLDMDEGIFDFDSSDFDSSDSDSSDSDSWASVRPKVREETKTGKIQSAIGPKIRREGINWSLEQDDFFGEMFKETVIPDTHDPQEDSDDDLGDLEHSGIGSRLLRRIM